MHTGYVAPSALPQNTTKLLIDDFVVQPWNGLETVVKTFLCPSKVVAVPQISSQVPTSYLKEFGARNLGTSKNVTYRL